MPFLKALTLHMYCITTCIILITILFSSSAKSESNNASTVQTTDDPDTNQDELDQDNNSQPEYVEDSALLSDSMTALHSLKGVSSLIRTPQGSDTVIDRQAVVNLSGRTVVSVTANNPPTGFDPTTDAAIPLGIPFHASIVRAAVLRLFKTGKYRDIKIGANPIGSDQVELIIDVLPMLRIKKLTVTGNVNLKNDDAARLLDYNSGRTVYPDTEVLGVYKKRILDKLGEIGYREAQAELSLLTTSEPGAVELLVDIKEGKPDIYSPIILRNIPLDVPTNLLGKKYKIIRNQDNLDILSKKIIAKLSNFGYLDAVLTSSTEKQTGKNTYELTLLLEPKIKSKISFNGNKHFLSHELTELLNTDGSLKTDAETVKKNSAKIRQHLIEHGFLFAEVSAIRRCLDGKNISILPYDKICPKSFSEQELEFRIVEGSNIDVVDVRFLGNTRFESAELKQEVFAFITEKNKTDSLFQPISAETLDTMGISDKRRFDEVRTPKYREPRYRKQRLYVPEQYAEVASHITSVYQEQGYLSAAVRDTCDLQTVKPIKHKGMVFLPTRITRIEDELMENAKESESPCIFVNRELSQMMIIMTVEEGPKTSISEIKFRGNSRIASSVLQEITGISVGDPFNEYQMREASRKLTERYRSLGHMFVEISWQRDFSVDMQRAAVNYNIIEGPIAKVGQIRIEGAEVTSKKIIRERLSLNSDDVITPDRLDKSQTLLMELGIFDGVTVEMISPEIAESQKNIRVQVKESKLQHLELRWGIATVEGLRGAIEYGFGNLGGFALNATLRARANYRVFFFGNPDFEARYKEMSFVEQLEHHVLVGLGSPHIPKTDGVLGWGIDLIKERLNKPGFSASRFTSFLKLPVKIALGPKYPLGLVITGKYGIEYNLDISAGIKTENPVLMRYLRLPQGTSAFSVLGLSIALDLRDSPFNPTKGFYLAIEADWVKSFSFIADSAKDWIEGDPIPIEKQSNLIRMMSTVSGYVPIFSTGLVLAMSVSVGYVFHLKSESTTWPDRYFYVGGVNTLRGFPEDDLVPEDIYQRWKSMLNNYGSDIDELLNNRGGEAMFLTRAELRFPLAAGFYGAGFAEFGNLWRDRKKLSPVVFEPEFKINLRPVAGLGLRYQTPLGPISFDLGINLKRRPTELPLSWYISIGTAF